MLKYLSTSICMMLFVSFASAEFYNMDFRDLTEALTIEVDLDGTVYLTPVGTLHFESSDIETSIYGFCSQASVMVDDKLAEIKYIMDYDQYNQTQLQKAGYVVQNFFPEVYNQVEGQATRDTYAAAAQAVLWEVLEETDGVYDLTAGHIQYDDGPNFSSSSEVWVNFQTYFQTMLTSLSGMSPDFVPNSDIKVFQMAGAQDVMTITTLPEPATLALLGIGAVLVRRRKN